jgi:hypothetical protein
LFVGYPEEFKEPPLGYFVYLHGRTMVANGEAARMVLYDYDFLPAAAGLNHRGKYQLAKIVAMMPCNFFPLIIQETPCSPELAEARRLAVFNELAKQPFPVPPERVVVGLPIAIGLRGAEAEQINRNLMANTEARGSIGAAAPALSNLLQQAPSVGPGAAVPAGTPPVGQ